MTFKKPEPVTGKIKSAGAQRDTRRRKANKPKRTAENAEMEEVINDEEQVRGSESDMLWALGDASDDEDEEEDQDVDHYQHPLHKDFPKARIASNVGGGQRRSSRRAFNERTALVTPEDEEDDGDYMNRSRMADSFRHDDERHEMHNVGGEVNERPQR